MGKICYSLTEASNTYCNFMAFSRQDAAIEIRLDHCMLDDEQLKALFSSERSAATVATFHIDSPEQVEEATNKLSLAILNGTDYVDIPVDWPEEQRILLVTLALNKGTRIIISYHNYKDTDDFDTLKSIAELAFQYGADIAKVVTTAKTPEDALSVLKLYDHFEASKLLAFAMGKHGYDSRLSSFAKGAPLFFMAPGRGKATAPGQPTYFDFVEPDRIILRGEAEVPASKSFAQRAIILAALTEGTTRLFGLSLCDDTEAAMRVAKCLGAELSLEGTTLTVTGHQNIQRDGLKVKDNSLFVGESGLLTRLCLPLCGLAKEDITVCGEKSLLTRRLDDHKQALAQLGVDIQYTNQAHLPATVKGTLHSGKVCLDGEKGSQMISGMILALSQCSGSSTLEVKNITSLPYIELTTYVASFFGIEDIDSPEVEGEDGTYRIGGNQKLHPVHGLNVEKDWSAAAMVLTAGAILGDITIKGLDPYSTQADSVIYLMMQENGIDIVENNGDVNVRKSIICPFYFDITDCPDLFAPLFLLATQAEGESVISGVHRLKNKESDRAATFASEFEKLGIHSRIEGDEIIIEGHENFAYKGGVTVSAHGDHRLGMALYIASLLAKSDIVIEEMWSIAKSFPSFVETIDKLKTK